MSEKEKMPEENLPEKENFNQEEETGAPNPDSRNNIDASSSEGENPASAEEKNPTADAMVEEAENKESHKEVSPSSPEASTSKEVEQQDEENSTEASAVSESGPENKDAQSEMENAVAEDSEDASTSERHGIEKKDYHAMSKEALVEELERLLAKEKVQTIKEHVEEIRAEFYAKFDEEFEEKKEEFLADGGNIIDFSYSTPLKKKFNSLVFDYKEKRNNYYQRLKKDLNKNLERRLEIIEELKGLIDVEENINTTYKHFKELQERWRNAGAIPRDKYNTIWNTYHHHVENFYDFLHLNREFRDMDFKHNLEQKLKIITRAEELTVEPDINRAFRELQMLHKMWKEDLGPVEKAYREDIWEKFSEATKKIHDRRQAHFEELEKTFEKNLEKKEEIIGKIRELGEADYNSHKKWQQKIEEMEALREEFFKAGKVPRAVNEETWQKFKEAVRGFNRKKNAFYKKNKKEQFDNLEKKKELVRIAEENKDSEDFNATTPLMKKIQSDWKKIGHVPKRDSEKIWKRFKSACNHYFDRVHASRSREDKEEMEAFDKKKELLDSFREIELSGDREKDLPVIKGFMEGWRNTGRVGRNKRFIEEKFTKALDQVFKKLDMDKKEAELLKYENRIQALDEADDTRRINKEHFFLTKKVEETQAEIRQLENNLQFFSNAGKDNPLVQEVLKNIENQKEQLKIWKEKLDKVNSLY